MPEMPEERRFKVLFLCTANSARSILSEYLLRKIGGDRFESFSAGSHPKGAVHPMALRILQEVYQIDASDARSKSFEELLDVPLDLVITVCDNAQESCPVWPGKTIMAHWGIPDPAAVEGPEQYAAFREAARVLARRIELLTSVPIEKMEHARLQQLAREIGTEQ